MPCCERAAADDGEWDFRAMKERGGHTSGQRGLDMQSSAGGGDTNENSYVGHKTPPFPQKMATSALHPLLLLSLFSHISFPAAFSKARRPSSSFPIQPPPFFLLSPPVLILVRNIHPLPKTGPMTSGRPVCRSLRPKGWNST